jgi:hypothetical protein
MTKIAGSGSISQRHGSLDPYPHQNVMDPQHWYLPYIANVYVDIPLMLVTYFTVPIIKLFRIRR